MLPHPWLKPCHQAKKGVYKISREGQGNEGILRSGDTEDFLLGCLVFLCAHYGRAKSAESIKAGLAYDDEGMGAELFCEAARRLEINAKIVKKSSVSAISAAVLPCVLLLSENQVCVLIELRGKKAKIFLPEEKTVRDISLETLQKNFKGYAIFTRPSAAFLSSDHKDEDNVTGHWFWGIVRGNRGVYVYVLLSSIFINLFVLVSPLFVMNVYDRVIPNNAVETGWALGIGAFVAFIFDFLFKTVRGYLIDFAGRKIDVMAARRIFDKLLDIRLAQRPPSSGAFANMLRDFDSVREFFTSATITALVDVPFGLVFLFMIAQLAGALALIPLAVIMIVLIAGYLVQFSLKSSVRKSLKTAESKHGLLVEAISGLETIKANNADGRFRARYAQCAGENARQSQRSRALSALGVNIASFFQQALSVIMILTGMYLVQDGVLTMGGLIASVILAGRAIAPIGQIANLMTRYHQASGSLKTLDYIMAKDVERPAGRQFLHRPNLRGKICFEHVNFTYPQTQNSVLRDVSFTIEAGERVGIIGRIGSGKSTIARLMLNLYEPEEGTIRIDDTDYRQIDPADLRRNTAYIAQDVVLFSGSVRDNITAAAPHTSEERLLVVAKASGVDDFISRHPMGYDAPVGEQGLGLSGGQRQAIALARAMITSPNILVCDEPTNAMDMQAEAAFCSYIREQIKGKTFIMITHKSTMLDMVDRLIVMHNGKLILDGRRDDVLRALDSGNVRVSGG